MNNSQAIFIDTISAIATEMHNDAFKYIKEAKTDLFFNFKLTKKEIHNFFEVLKKDRKYQEWHTVDGIDTTCKKCIEVKIQPYLRIRN